MLYEFTGLIPTEYPFDRDADGKPLGTVDPGETRNLGRPLDWQWVPADPSGGEESGAAEGDVPDSGPEPEPAPQDERAAF